MHPGPNEKVLTLDRVEILVNERSGGVGPGAAQDAHAIALSCGLQANTVSAASPGAFRDALIKALSRAPDALVLLAGDGTARAVCARCGPAGPPVAPLPGGTMNMLPRALYGDRDWRTALTDSLTHSAVRTVGGGEIDGLAFHVAAILGNAALWAPARESLRHRHVLEALRRARIAFSRAFSTKLTVALDDEAKQSTEALALLCPLVSRALAGQETLEAALLNPANAGEVLRMALHAALGPLVGDWRQDAAVQARPCLSARVWNRGRIPAILDGEVVRLRKRVTIHYRPVAFRALVPAEPADEDSDAAMVQAEGAR